MYQVNESLSLSHTHVESCVYQKNTHGGIIVGSNDGMRDGKRYFQTDRNRGIFVRREDVELLDD